MPGTALETCLNKIRAWQFQPCTNEDFSWSAAFRTAHLKPICEQVRMHAAPGQGAQLHDGDEACKVQHLTLEVLSIAQSAQVEQLGTYAADMAVNFAGTASCCPMTWRHLPHRSDAVHLRDTFSAYGASHLQQTKQFRTSQPIQHLYNRPFVTASAAACQLFEQHAYLGKSPPRSGA